MMPRKPILFVRFAGKARSFPLYLGLYPPSAVFYKSCGSIRGKGLFCQAAIHSVPFTVAIHAIIKNISKKRLRTPFFSLLTPLALSFFHLPKPLTF
jgi:hypothetical protein